MCDLLLSYNVGCNFVDSINPDDREADQQGDGGEAGHVLCFVVHSMPWAPPALLYPLIPFWTLVSVRRKVIETAQGVCNTNGAR